MTDQPPPEKNKNRPANGRQSGWVEKLARQSSGLEQPKPPTDTTPASDDKEESKRLWRLAGNGVQMAVLVGVFWFLGHAIDQWRSWHGGAAISLTVIAVVGSLYLLIKEGIKANKDK